jgi:nickel/cobalt exporter
VLLGLSAAISHTAVVWAAALIGLYCSEARLSIASAVIILGVAVLLRTRFSDHRGIGRTPRC